MLKRLLRRWDAPASLRPAGSAPQGALAIRWLGTAAHSLRVNGETLLLDPFVSRPGFARLLRPLRSDSAALARWAPEASAVVIGHAHFDHLLDAPEIALRTGATLIGSRSVARVGEAHGVEPGRLRVAGERGLVTQVGPFEVRLVPSLHAKLILGWAPPFPGEIERVPARRPLYFHEYKVGGAYGVLVRAGGVTVYHNGSADLIDAELDGLQADVLLVGLAGRKYASGYLERLVRLLRPRVIVPTHYDAFFWPIEDGLRLLPGIAMDEFLADCARVAPQARVVAPTPFDELRVGPGGEVAVVPLS